MDIKTINLGESGLETSDDAEINIVKNDEESDILAFEDMTDKETMDGDEDVPEFVMNDTDTNTEQETDLDSEVEDSETESDETNSESENEDENNSDNEDDDQTGGEKNQLKKLK